MPNRAQRRHGSTNEVALRAGEMARGYEERITRQVDIISRLQHQLKTSEDYIETVDRLVGILIMAAGGEIEVSDQLVTEFDRNMLVRTRDEEKRSTIFTATKSEDDDGEE